MTQQEITNLLQETKTRNIAVVDVRTYYEREQIAPINTLHIPLDEIESRLWELKNFDEVYFFCKAGVRSAGATEIAKKHGFNAFTISNSIFEIEAASLDI